MTHELYKTKEEIENWLNQYKIKKYELIKDKKYGYVVNVNGDVDLYKKNLEEIKVKFNIIKGSFYCNDNALKTLEGCPKKIDGNFYCDDNLLNSLKGSPKEINGYFDCGYNELKTLEGLPKKINGDFNCCNNKLETLKGCPEIINGKFYCYENKINNLNYFPEKVSGLCYLQNNVNLKELQNIEIFNEIKILLLNKKLVEEISIDNNKKNDKVKL